MTLASLEKLQLCESVVQLLEGQPSEEEARRLKALLSESAEARHIYAGYAAIRALLELDVPTLACDETAILRGESHEESVSSIPPIVLDLSTTIPSSLFSLHSAIGSFVFSWTMAAVILGVGLLIGTTWKIHHDRQIATTESRERFKDVEPSQKTQIIGHVNGMADCVWADPKSQIVDKAPVLLGSKFALAAGLLEITYDTGAKVILQGPCSYEVDSADGGYLSVGKLTAYVKAKTQAPRPKTHVGSAVELPRVGSAVELPRVGSAVKLLNQLDVSGSKGERTANLALSLPEREPTTSLAPCPSASKEDWETRRQGDKGKIANVESPSLPVSQSSCLPLFAVRTPTAVVTDLGTEFGVEVDHSGATFSHVSRGKVEMRPVGASDLRRAVQLGAGDSAQVKHGSDQVLSVFRDPAQFGRFVWQMPGSTNAPRSLSLKRGATIAYRLIDLGTLGGKNSRAAAINAAGQVVGAANVAGGGKHAFLYSNGKMKDLGTLHGGNSGANGLNSLGQVVGYSAAIRGDSRAFLYDGGTMKDLGTLGGPTACAYAINDLGQIVGESSNSSGVSHAFLYSSDRGMIDLGALGGAKVKSMAMSINAAGQVAGISVDPVTHARAFLYSISTGMKDIGAFDDCTSSAFRINDAGQVVGALTIGNSCPHAFLYSSAAGMRDLGALGGALSMACGINGRAEVVGSTDRSGPAGAPVHAFLYRDGAMFDLNSSTDSAAGWTLVTATAINDSGQIVGYGTAPDGNVRAFLLTPKTGEKTEDGREKK